MRPQIVIRYIGQILVLTSFFLFVSAAISFFNSLDEAFFPLVLSFVLVLVLGLFPLIFVERANELSSRESYLIVAGGWVVLCVVGMFPYLLYGDQFDLTNAWFESVSGFTTTGATILGDVESLPRGLLFWRSSTHFIGGLGIVVFALIVAPSVGGRGRTSIVDVEQSSFVREHYRYRMSTTIRVIVTVYLGLNVAETLMLRMAGMNWFDAVNHSFATIATGGFSTRNLSVAAYESVPVEMIITFFMIISGLHFGLLFATFTGRHNNVFRSPVARYFVFSFLVVVLAVALNLWLTGTYDSFGRSLRFALFQVGTLATSTGFASADSSVWPPLSILLLILITIQGGTAGSTSGGVKCDRVLVIFKSFVRQLRQQSHPHAVLRIKLGDKFIDDRVVEGSVSFAVMFMLFVVGGTVVCCVCNIDLLTAFSASVACMANAGPGFGLVGSMANFGFMPDVAKDAMALLMLFGRLEIMGLILLFVRRGG